MRRSPSPRSSGACWCSPVATWPLGRRPPWQKCWSLRGGRYHLRLPPATASCRTRASSSGARTAQCSTPGTRLARACIAGRTRSRTTSGRQSTSDRWSSGTAARAPARGSASRAIPRRERSGSSASTSRTPRARTSSRASGPGADRGDARADAGSFRATRPDPRAPRDALSRPPGRRVHGRGGNALPAPDAHGQTDGRCSPAGSRGHGRRGPHLEGGSGRADRPGPARPAPASPHRPGGDDRGRGEGPQRVTRCRLRGDRARCGHGRGAWEGGRGRHPRPLGDDAGRHSRAHPGSRRPHRARRDDVACRRRRARDGKAVRRRLRGLVDRRRHQEGHHRRATSSRRAT